jgi:hypothetical protein
MNSGGILGGPLFGSGGLFGKLARPTGMFGPWVGCGCGSLVIIVVGLLLVCAGLVRMF